MTIGPHDSDSGRHDVQSEARRSVGNVAPFETLVSGAVGDRCVNCGAPLSSDQRYCVVCGERRGAPRFSLPQTSREVQTVETAAARPAPDGRRFASGTTLVAGVATLLLAMLVGVLIGHNTAGSGTRTVASAPVRIITTGGRSAYNTAVSRPTSATGSAHTTARHGSSKKAATGKLKPKKATPRVTKKTAAAESGAAAKVLGGKSTPPATVTVGSTGTGKGYSKKTHKFTGSFFGQ